MGGAGLLESCWSAARKRPPPQPLPPLTVGVGLRLGVRGLSCTRWLPPKPPPLPVRLNAPLPPLLLPWPVDPEPPNPADSRSYAAAADDDDDDSAAADDEDDDDVDDKAPAAAAAAAAAALSPPKNGPAKRERRLLPTAAAVPTGWFQMLAAVRRGEPLLNGDGDSDDASPIPEPLLPIPLRNGERAGDRCSPQLLRLGEGEGGGPIRHVEGRGGELTERAR